MPKPYNGHSYRCRKCNTAKVNRYLSTDNGKKKTYSAINNYHRNNPEKVKARYLARRYNFIPDSCSNCGLYGSVDGHHQDYSDPINVIWLCRECHADIHSGVVV